MRLRLVPRHPLRIHEESLMAGLAPDLEEKGRGGFRREIAQRCGSQDVEMLKNGGKGSLR
jgi:hypothetical protein